MRKIIALLIVIMLVSVMLVGCTEGTIGDETEQTQDSTEAPEDISEYEVDLVAEDEVDIGEMI